MEGIGKEGTSEKKRRNLCESLEEGWGVGAQLFAQTLGRVQSNHIAIQSKAGGFELRNKQWL